MKRIYAVIVVTASASCGNSSGEAVRNKRVCDLLGQRLAARMRAHEADRESFLNAAAADDSGLRAERSLAMAPRIGDFVATHEVAARFGAGCAEPDLAPCHGVGAPVLLAHVDAAYREMEELRRGFAGQGPCAPTGDVQTTPCEAIRVNLAGSAREVGASLAVWPPTVDASGLVPHEALRAIRAVSRWRAELDYALAAAPVCLPATVAASCATLQQDLANAEPEDLALRISALSDAYRLQKACRMTTAPKT